MLTIEPPASKEQRLQLRGCARKRPFQSRKAAKDVATKIKKLHGAEQGVYRCANCGLFHLFTER